MKWEHVSIFKHLMDRLIGLCIDILLCQKLSREKKRRGGNIIKAQNVEWCERHTRAFNMSVLAFIDISEEDQAAELQAYLKSKGPEISD